MVATNVLHDLLFALGRVLLGGFFLYNGVNHLRNLDALTGYAGSVGIPAPRLATAGTGVLMLLGGAGVLLGAYPEIALGLLVLFLVPTSFLMHAFWSVEDPQQRGAQRVQFLKNVAVLGAVLMLAAMATPWPWSLGWSLF